MKTLCFRSTFESVARTAAAFTVYTYTHIIYIGTFKRLASKPKKKIDFTFYNGYFNGRNG